MLRVFLSFDMICISKTRLNYMAITPIEMLEKNPIYLKVAIKSVATYFTDTRSSLLDVCTSNVNEA